MADIEITGELWRLTMDHSPVGVAVVSPDARCLMANAALATMLGYSADELRELPFDVISHPEDLVEDVRLFGETLRGERSSYRMVKRYFHADGSIVWGDLSVVAVRQQGVVAHVVAQVVDLTEQYSQRAQLAAARSQIDEQRRMAEAVFNTVDVGLLFIDADGTYRGSNRRHHDFLVAAFPDGHHGVAGQLGEVYDDGGRRPMVRERLPSFRAQQGEEFDDVRMWLGPPEREQLVISASARSVYDAEGRFVGAALVYKDVTDYVRALTVRDDFLASVSHELRTPLTSVLGHLEMLMEDPGLSEELSRRVRTVERNAARLAGLVGDLLQVARQREGGLPVAVREADLAPVVRDAVEAARPAAEAAGLSLVQQTPAELVGRADPGRLRQVVDNLVANAVKYSEPGAEVRVGLDRSDGHVELVVADTGIGIAAGDLERLFDRFYRGEDVQRRQIAGSGLGLSIVRSIVEAHHGEIDVESEPGVGTTVTVTLPTTPGG